MRLGSLVYRHSRLSLVLSLLSIAFLASLFLRLWPAALLLRPSIFRVRLVHG